MCKIFSSSYKFVSYVPSFSSLILMTGFRAVDVVFELADSFSPSVKENRPFSHLITTFTLCYFNTFNFPKTYLVFFSNDIYLVFLVQFKAKKKEKYSRRNVCSLVHCRVSTKKDFHYIKGRLTMFENKSKIFCFDQKIS